MYNFCVMDYVLLFNLRFCFFIKTVFNFAGRSPPTRPHQHGGVSDVDVRRRQRICESGSGHLGKRLGHRADAAEPEHRGGERAGLSGNEVNISLTNFLSFGLAVKGTHTEILSFFKFKSQYRILRNF
jgi:hypothetical protein